MSSAENAIRLINGLTHTGDFAGEPFRLRPWQAEIVRGIFAEEGGRRKHRKVFLGLPRKQGKTELAAAVLLVLLCGSGRKGQHIYSASGDREQASLIFRAAASMVRNNPHLAEVCQVYDGYKRIAFEPADSFYQALSSDAPRKHGLGPSAVLFDEVHVLPNRELHDVLTTGFGARRDPLTLYITTAGWDRHSLCYELWRYAEQVRDGVIKDPSFLPILYGARPEDDWTDEETWKRAMPALGDFCHLDNIREEFEKAKQLPTYENTVRQLYLNQWTEQAKRWISLETWDKCRAEIDWNQYEGRECFAGLDLSSKADLTALVLLFPNELGGFDLKPTYWLPGESAAQRERMDRVPYPVWVREGHIRKTEGQRIDYDLIREEVELQAQQYRFRACGFDPQFAGQIANQLYRDGDGVPVVEVQNTFTKLNPASHEFERLVVEGKIRHDGNPVLRWNVANVAIAEKAGMILPSKFRSRERIDGVSATVMGLAVTELAPEDERSVYETEGLLLL